MYKGLYPVLVQWKLPLGQAAVPAEKESLLNVFQARHVSSIHRKHEKNRWKLAVVVNVCNPSSWEMKSRVGSSRSFSATDTFEASLSYIRVSTKQNIPRTKGRNYLQRPATEPSSLPQLLLRQPTPNSSLSFTSATPFSLTPPPTSERCLCWLFLARDLTSSWKLVLGPTMPSADLVINLNIYSFTWE